MPKSREDMATEIYVGLIANCPYGFPYSFVENKVRGQPDSDRFDAIRVEMVAEAYRVADELIFQGRTESSIDYTTADLIEPQAGAVIQGYGSLIRDDMGRCVVFSIDANSGQVLIPNRFGGYGAYPKYLWKKAAR